MKRTPLKRRGKHARLWDKTRREFIKQNPDRRCVVCGQLATDIDHIQNRGSHPELRYELSNLQWMCRLHHQMKTDNKLK